MVSSVADDFCASKAYEIPHKALKVLLGDRDAIVIGRASNYAYNNEPGTARIFLCGDRAERVKILQISMASQSGRQGLW